MLLCTVGEDSADCWARYPTQGETQAAGPLQVYCSVYTPGSGFDSGIHLIGVKILFVRCQTLRR